jgi:signal transduction histidine kinase/DNA-binding response OmpR family regulator
MEPTSSNHALKILLVDDDRQEWLLLQDLLSTADSARYEIEWVPSFEQGVEAVLSPSAHCYAACLLDNRIGGRTGLEFLEAIQTKPRQFPVLLYTGQRSPTAEENALRAGAADYLIKGKLDVSGLDRAIRFAIERHRLISAAAAERARLASFGAEVGSALTRAGTPEQVLTPCVEAMIRFLPIQLAQIYVFSPQRGELTMTASEGVLASQPPPLAPAAVDFINGEAFLSCPATEDHRLADREWLVRHKMVSAVTYPLMLNEHLLGLIILYSKEVITRSAVEELGSVAPGIGAYLARLSLEAQIRRTQQLDCVGKMAAGLAHEFKNNLMVIRAHVERALEGCPESSITRDRLNLIVGVTEDATHLAQQLMLFARPQGNDAKPLDLNDTLLRMRPMIQGAVDQRIGLTFTCAAMHSVVEADPGSLQQIVINLAVNARDAMPDGGTLVVRTDNVEVDATRAATNPDAFVGRFVRLQVTDSGCGMSLETQARLFEPFFTTKGPGKGNGLGLATVFTIVRKHRGWIEVNSEVGKGTTFSLFLPECHAAIEEPDCCACPANALEDRHRAVNGNLQTVLVVEDEPVLREAAEATLRNANFDVTVASSGQEALRIWQEHDGKFDVLLTDLSMPEGMTGMQLATQLVQANPRLKVILTSGYAPEMVEADRECRDALFLQKPYPPSLLPETVSKCLGI